MTYDELWHSLLSVYPQREAKAIVQLVLSELFSMTFTDIVCGKVNELSINEERELMKNMSRLLTGEPVQYVLGVADFCGRKFMVGQGVLIPRPETEELCRLVEADNEDIVSGMNVLDIGTGSGCIAVTLALDMPKAHVSAWDISEKALSIASSNAKKLCADVAFQQVDALNAPSNDSQKWDIIVSNPPYVCDNERSGMEHNVLDYEPEVALFVPDDDPLRFYKAIARYAKTALKENGWLYFEINPLYASDIADMLKEQGFENVVIIKDNFDHLRFAKAMVGR
jgi:release factor glutamine methyltransferase